VLIVLRFVVACLSLMLGLSSVLAQATGGTITDTGGWTVTIKANAFASPTYPGSAHMGFMAFPSGSIRRAGANAAWGAPDDSLGAALYTTDTFEIGPVIRYQAGRYSGQAKELRGLTDLRWSVEPGIYAQAWLVPDSLRARFELRRGFHGHEGVVGSFGLDAVQRYGAWTFSAGPRMQVADAEYMKSFYGVTQRDAAWNGRVAAYKPNAGLKSYGATGAATYRLNDAWSTTVSAQWERLTGPAANSPLIRNIGKRDQITVGVGLSYSFSWR
jgi:MipA family protein